MEQRVLRQDRQVFRGEGKVSMNKLEKEFVLSDLWREQHILNTELSDAIKAWNAAEDRVKQLRERSDRIQSVINRLNKGRT